MFDLAELTAFVNKQAEFHRQQAEKHGRDQVRSARHLETASEFEILLAYLTQQQGGQVDKKPLRIALSWDEVQDLPPELLEELTVSETDRIEFLILSIMEKHDGVIGLDRLLVELYRATGEVFKRQGIINRLYKMANKGEVQSVEGKKGVYTTKELSEEEYAALR